MKKLAAVTLCLALLCLCLHAQAESRPLTIAAAADLHVNPAYRTTGVINPLEPYHLQLVDAYLWDAAQIGADALLLLGDVTNQGKLAQHEALIKKLRAAQEKGVDVYVLPGNHDIGEVDAERFAALYADFGYGGALSRDSASLSYSVLLGSQLLLLLDTNGYSGQRDSAFLKAQTLDWMRAQLEQAAQMGWQVLAAGHYPLLTSNSTPFTGREEAVRLLEAYGVTLYLCGHLHKRCVTIEGELTELVVEQPIAYPCSYAAVMADGAGGYRYAPRATAVSEWAKQHGVTDEHLIDFAAYQTALEQERCADVVEKVRREKAVSAQEQRQAEDFSFQLSQCRAYGTVSRCADMLRAHPGYDVMLALSEGTIYHRWIPSVIDTAVPYTTGFTLRGGQIEATGGEAKGQP